MYGMKNDFPPITFVEGDLRRIEAERDQAILRDKVVELERRMADMELRLARVECQ